MLAIIALGVGVTLVVVGGITGQAGDVTARLADAKETIAGWLGDLGIDPASATEATQDASAATSDSVSALLHGVVGGLSAALLRRLLSRDDRAHPLLPAQGRPDDPRLDRGPQRASRSRSRRRSASASSARCAATSSA